MSKMRFSLLQNLLKLMLMLMISLFVLLGWVKENNAATITVTNPTSGVIWYKGTNYYVNWTSSSVTGNVKIELYKGTTPVLQPAANDPNDGSMQFNPPSYLADGLDYRFAITGVSMEVTGWSAYFAIMTNPTITVTSPNGGETLIKNQNYPIYWTSSNLSGNVKIEVYKGTIMFKQLAANDPNDGNCTFTPDNTFVDGTDYRVAVASVNDGSIYDYSNNYFTIQTPKSLDVTYPNGGETLFKGTDYTITWTSSSSVVGNVRIDLYKGNGETPVLALAANDPNDGSYLFNPPSSLVDGADYKVCISAESGSVSNCGGAFAITRVSSPVLVTPINNATLNGANIAFAWTSVSNAESYEILVDNNSGFGSPELNETIAAPTTSRTVVNHLPDNVYFWKVRAKFANGSYTAWSTIQTFTYQLPVYASAFWVPLYRMYNSASKDHFYTTVPFQRDTAKASGYTYEKIEAYVSDRKFNDANVGYLFCLYSPTNDVHFYTSSESEKDARIIAGYTYEGIVGFVYTAATDGMAPLHYLEHAANTDNFYTISKYEHDNAINTYGFADHSIQCYVSPSAVANNRPQGVFAGIGMFNGALSVAFTDLTLKGVGPGLTMTRYYNSYNFYELPFGGGWSHSLSSYAIEHPNGTINDVTIKWGNGTEDFFKSDGSNNFSGIIGTFSKLVRVNGDLYELTAKDQTVYTFARVTVNNTMGASFIPDLPLIGIRDKFGNEIVLSPNAANGRIDRADRKVNGATTVQSFTFHYDENNRLASIVDTSVSPNRTVSYGYNENGLLSSVTDARGHTTYYTYTSEELLNTITYPEGNTVTVVYDQHMRAKSYTNGNIKLSFDYDDTTGTTVKSGTIPMINFTHDSLSRAGSITYPDATTVTAQFGTANYVNLRDSTKDRLNQTTSYTYDANGNVTSVKNAKNETTGFEYDEKNNLTAIVDPRNAAYRTILTYDTETKNKLEIITLPMGEKTLFEHYDNGLMKERIDPTGHKMVYTYDGNGNLTQIKDDALSTHVDFGPDGAGRVLSKTDPYTVLSPANQQSVGTIYTYDENDNLTSVKVGSNQASIYTFDRNNRMTYVTDQRSKATHFTYNKMNLLETQTSPDGKTWSYVYNSLGKVQTENRPDGSAMTYEYDNNNRLWKTYLNGSLKVTYTYDANGNVKTVSEDSRITTMNYDEVDRITSVQDPFGNTVGYGYDAAGNRTSITYPGSKTVNYTYDANNRLSTVQDWLSSAKTTYNYSAQGMLQSITNANGTTRKFTYDPADRLTDIANKKADTSSINDYHLTLNKVNMPTKIVRNEALIIPVPTASNTGYAYTDANQITTAGSVSYTHDPLGNMNGANDGRSLTFDFANRLIQAVIGGQTRNYTYDALRNRISKTVDGVETRYLLDLNGGMSQILADMDGANTVKNYYVYGDGNLLYRISNSNQRFTYHYDHLGSTTAVTDDSGTITEQYAYDEFGKVLASGPANVDNPFRYVGEYGVMDEGNGLLFMRARYYDTANGRFLSRDPLGYGSGDLNLYAYVGGNPVVGIDPKGLNTEELTVYQNKDGKIVHNIQETNYKETSSLEYKMIQLKEESDKIDRRIRRYDRWISFFETTEGISRFIIGFVPVWGTIANASFDAFGAGLSFATGQKGLGIRYSFSTLWDVVGGVAGYGVGKANVGKVAEIGVSVFFDGSSLLCDYGLKNSQ